MKDTCKQTSQHRTAPRVELICTGGDQPKSRIRIFQQALLQNAVKNIPQLGIVETLDEYTSTTSGAGHAHTSPTHPTTIFSLMLVLGMMQPILPLPLREGMYIQLLVPL